MGAIAPGYVANLVVLNDINTVSIREVYQKGISTKELEFAKLPLPDFTNTVKISALTDADFNAPKGRVHIIDALDGKILTDRHVGNSNDPGVAQLTVLERYGHLQKPAHAYVHGFGENFRGAIASTVGHDSHNLILVGTNASDMKMAADALSKSGGGFCVVHHGAVLAHLPLPIGGLMTDQNSEDIHRALTNLKLAAKEVGCTMHEPFLQLAFLSLPVIPSLKLTNLGLVDVDAFKLISLTV